MSTGGKAPRRMLQLKAERDARASGNAPVVPPKKSAPGTSKTAEQTRALKWSGSIAVRMKRMLFDEKFSDVTFLVGPKKEAVPACKMVLAAISEVFEHMFYGDEPQPQPVPVPDVEPRVFRAIMKYAYTDEADFTSDNVGPLVCLAKKYMIAELCDKAVHFAKHAMDASNVLDFLEMSNDVEAIKQCCYDVIVRSMIESDEFLESIDDAILSQVLDQDELPAPESVLFDRCVEWAKKKLQRENKSVDDAKEIRNALGELLFKIRFPTMDKAAFTGATTKYGILTEEECDSMLAWYESKEPPPFFNVKPRTILPIKPPGGYSCIWSGSHSYNCVRCKKAHGWSGPNPCPIKCLKCDCGKPCPF